MFGLLSIAVTSVADDATEDAELYIRVAPAQPVFAVGEPLRFTVSFINRRRHEVTLPVVRSIHLVYYDCELRPPLIQS
jgi:hypothetical protein